LKVIVLGPSYESYGAASYQRDFLRTLSELSTNYYHSTSKRDINTNEIINKAGFVPDIIIYNHGWLNDIGEEICSFNVNGEWPNKKIKHIFMLNKEYVRLKDKVNYINNSNFDLIVSHCHKLSDLANFTKPLFFMPLAYSESFENEFISKPINEREYDLTFSGILQNPNGRWSHTDIREKIQKEFFYCFFDLPIIKKFRYRDLNIYWKPFYAATYPPGPMTYKIKLSILMANIKNRISSLLCGKRCDEYEYKKLLYNSKAVLHTASTLGIISTRVFEVLRCGAIGLFSKDSQAQTLFKPGIEYTEFNNISELVEKIYSIKFSRNSFYDLIAKRGNENTKKNHNWEARVNALFQEILVLN